MIEASRMDEIFSSFWNRFDTVSEKQWKSWTYLLDNYSHERYDETVTGLEDPVSYGNNRLADYFQNLKENDWVVVQKVPDEEFGFTKPNQDAIAYISPQEVELPYNVFVDEKVAEIYRLVDLEETTYMDIREQENFTMKHIEEQLGGDF